MCRDVLLFLRSSLAALGVLLGLIPTAQAMLDCESLRQHVVAQENASNKARVQIVGRDAVGAARVLGSCEGGSKRVVLAAAGQPVKESSLKAGAAAGMIGGTFEPVHPPQPSLPEASKVLLAGARTPGSHQATGPFTCVNLVKYPVNTPTPTCEQGTTTPDAILDRFSKTNLPGISQLAQWANDQGFGDNRHQDFASCSFVCTLVPGNAQFSDETTYIMYKLDVDPKTPYRGMGKADEDRWGPGAEGYWRIDKGLKTQSLPDRNQLVCKVARNWSDSHSRSFRLVVNYKVGSSAKVNPPTADNGYAGCGR